MAPFAPFAAEDLYQKLRTEKGVLSIHLEVWPEEGMVDEKLLEKMDLTRHVVTVALEARSKANIKVRQPLSKLEIKTKLDEEYLEIIKDELNVKSVVINENLTEEVSLDVTLTPELLEESKVRDAMRAVQEWRKEQGLKPGEKAPYPIPDSEQEIFRKFGEEIRKTTNVEF